jgi:hypothetical protein
MMGVLNSLALSLGVDGVASSLLGEECNVGSVDDILRFGDGAERPRIDTKEPNQGSLVSPEKERIFGGVSFGFHFSFLVYRSVPTRI